MSNFNNTSYSATFNNLLKGATKRLNNPYYLFNDKRPTIVTYWNINDKKSTLDTGSRQTEMQLTKDSPLRYNRIDNFIIYGIERVITELSVGEMGLEAGEITGDAFILPNTVIPTPDDYFKIDYLAHTYLFRVVSATPDTLDNGSNLYKISYKLEKTRQEYLDNLNNSLLVDTFTFITGNVGTNFKAVIRNDEYSLCSDLTDLLIKLKKYYIALFYKSSIQTFTLYDQYMYLYDPYLIEFLIRTRIFSTIGDYMYIQNECYQPSSFIVEYDQSIFKNFEDRDSSLNHVNAYPYPIDDPNSLMVNRLEQYNQLVFRNSLGMLNTPYYPLSTDLYSNITQNILYDISDKYFYRNILIDYLNSDSKDTFIISKEEIKSLDRLNYFPCKDLFYEIPLLMFVINKFILGLMDTDNDPNDKGEKTYVSGN